MSMIARTIAPLFEAIESSLLNKPTTTLMAISAALMGASWLIGRSVKRVPPVALENYLPHRDIENETV